MVAKKKRKILVTGATGVVGSYITSIFPDDTLFLTNKNDFDITDKKNVLKVLQKLQPTVVIHLAAKTNVDECEKNSEEAHRINGLGTQNIAEGCKVNGAFLVYISTGAVFNGKKKFFTEKDTPDPVNVYGKTKLYGEQAIQKLLKKYIIIRAGWIIGGGVKEKKFLAYVLQQIKNGAKEIHVINDTLGTLTYGKELVEYIKFLLDNDAEGMYHFGSRGICSRYDIAKHLAHLLDVDVTITSVPSSYFSSKFFAPRPKNEVIASKKLPQSYTNMWQQSLTNYIMNELQYE